MTPDQKAALDKIKKLLRMKRGGSAGEVENALRMAQEIAAKHGIDLSSVNPDEEERERPITHVDEILGARIQFECKYAALVCHQFFHVEVFAGRNGDGKFKLTFVGTEWDQQIALYVYRFLVRHFRYEWTHNRGRLRNRQAFLWGMYLGLCSKLREKNPEHSDAHGLVHLERALVRRQQYVKDRFGDLSSSSVKPDDDAGAARRRGYDAGQKTEIRPALKGSPVATPKLAPPERPQLQPSTGQLALL